MIHGALRGLDLVETRVAEPHRRLMAAVLRAVVDDYRDQAWRRSGWDGAPPASRRVDDVRDYIASADRKWPFSFENLCDALGIDPDFLRLTLQREHDDRTTIKTIQSV